MKLGSSFLLYTITDSEMLRGRSLYDCVADAISGGATMVQYREKHMGKDAFLLEAQTLQKLCAEKNVPFIINDNVDAALACGADGVHVGQSDMEVSRVREMVGEDMIVGVSAQTVNQALKAERSGADYLGVGAVFSTSTKPDADSVSFNTLKAICEAVKIPVVAIGGINANNIIQLHDSGIDGVALVSAVFAQDDIEAATKNMLDLAKKL